MGSKSEASYTAVVEKIKTIWPEFKPERFLTDFEQGMRNSLGKAYLTAEIIGCFFHYCQASIP